MSDLDDLTVLISHDAKKVPTTVNSTFIEHDSHTSQHVKKMHYDLPFMNAYQKHPFISILRALYREIDAFDGISQSEIRELKQKLILTMDNHTRLLSEQGIENTHIMIVRYILATFVDDTLSHMPWQNNVSWADSSLLHYYYQETYGGEKFFQLLEQFIKEPHKYIQHIELAYICISMGYKGRYALDKSSRGEVELERIRNELYKNIRNFTAKDDKFYEGHPVSDKKHKLFLHIPYKLFIMGGLILLGVVYAIYTNTVSDNEDELIQMLNSEKVDRTVKDSNEKSI
jgi:type VI secretion system protein ImpK